MLFLFERGDRDEEPLYRSKAYRVVIVIGTLVMLANFVWAVVQFVREW